MRMARELAVRQPREDSLLNQPKRTPDPPSSCVTESRPEASRRSLSVFSGMALEWLARVGERWMRPPISPGSLPLVCCVSLAPKPWRVTGGESGSSRLR